MNNFHRFLMRVLFYVFVGLASLMILTVAVRAQSFETRAQQALLLDVETGSILFSKNPDDQIPPASLAKLMTMEVVFNAISIGRLSLDDEFVVSENAWRNGGTLSGGSTMFAELNSSIRLEDLIKGVIVQSANDGCIIIAEGMAGSEENFARIMTERARAIGLQDSVFVNSTGLPAEGQFVTMRDLVKLADHIQREYPEFYQFYSMREFEWNNINQRNRNPLLGMNIGADGVKTGFTEASGYAIVGSTLVNGRRLIVALSGLETQRARREEARKVLEWGRRAFVPYRLFEDGQPVGSVRLFGGEATSVEVLPEKPLRVMLPLTGSDDVYRARIYYDLPVRAPVEEGDEIATLRLFLDDEIAFEAPLFAADDVAKGPIHRQAFDALGGVCDRVDSRDPGMNTDALAESPDMSATGVFITFEGGEGVGKSTQIQLLAERLRLVGREVVVSREPGGTPGAEAVRHVILSAGMGEPFGPTMEAILFAAARNDHVEQVIRPAVERGAVVLVDRFMDSTRVYQGVSGNLPVDLIASLERVAIAGMTPDLTIVLDLEPAEGMARARARRGEEEVADRFEKEQLAVHEARRNAFVILAESEPRRIKLVDASTDTETVANRVWKIVRALPQFAREPNTDLVVADEEAVQ